MGGLGRWACCWLAVLATTSGPAVDTKQWEQWPLRGGVGGEGVGPADCPAPGDSILGPGALTTHTLSHNWRLFSCGGGRKGGVQGVRLVRAEGLHDAPVIHGGPFREEPSNFWDHCLI